MKDSEDGHPSKEAANTNNNFVLSPEKKIEVANNLKTVRDHTKEHIEVYNVEIVRPSEIIDCDMAYLNVGFYIGSNFFDLFFGEVSLAAERGNSGLGNMSMVFKRCVKLLDDFSDIARIEDETDQGQK